MLQVIIAVVITCIITAIAVLAGLRYAIARRLQRQDWKCRREKRERLSMKL